MINTLRIAGVIAVVLSVGFLFFFSVFGISSDEKIEQYLSSKGAIEKFDKTKGQRGAKDDSQISPLVKQAEAFALYLNPPKPKVKPKANRKPAVKNRRPSKVSAKFKLIGTSYYMLHPDMSLALIDEPGKGFRWVRQSDKVGHLVIDKIEDSSIVVLDGKKTFEMSVVESPKSRNLVKKSSSDRAGAKLSGALKAADTTVTDTGVLEVDSSQMGGREEKAFDELVNRLEAMRRDIDSNEAEFDSAAEDALMEDLMAELQAARTGDRDEINEVLDLRMSREEAEVIGDLGEELKDIQEEEDITENQKDEIVPDSNEPNDVAE